MPKNNEVTTRIAPGANVRGKVSGGEDLSVGGRIEGSVHLMGALFVEPDGIVKADVFVTRAVISGIVVGNVEATESIQIAAGGRVQGDLHAPRISIVEGARFAGAIDMGAVEARAVEDMRTVIERRTSVPPIARPIIERPIIERPIIERPHVAKPMIFEGAVPARPSEKDTPAFVSPVTTRPGDARRKRIVVKKRS